MKNIKFILITLVFSIFIVTFGNNFVVAEKETQVFDYAGLFESSKIDELNLKINEVSEKIDADIVIVTTNDADGKTSREFADDFFDYNGFGFGENHDGVLYLIDMDNRVTYISTTGKMISYLSDARIEWILDEINPKVAEEKYYESADKFISEIEHYYLKGIPTGGAKDSMGRFFGGIPLPLYIVISATLGTIAALAFIFYLKHKYSKVDTKIRFPFNSNVKLKLTDSKELLIKQFVTSRRIPTNTGGSGGSGGSSTHTSSSGGSHGGGGRSF